MKKRYLFLSLAFIAFLSSALPERGHDLETGRMAPSIVYGKDNGVCLWDQGKMLIVNFWSASDPVSRLVNHQMSVLANRPEGKSYRLVSVCIDDDYDFARQLIASDCISDLVEIASVHDFAKELPADYQVKSGCRAFRIDSYGILQQVSVGQLPI